MPERDSTNEKPQPTPTEATKRYLDRWKAFYVGSSSLGAAFTAFFAGQKYALGDGPGAGASAILALSMIATAIAISGRNRENS